MGGDDPHADGGHDADPTRVVADADVLAADLLVGGPARAALDVLRRHSWLDLVVTTPLLADAEALIADLADETLAGDWRRRVDGWAVRVEQPAGDHPALAAAYRGDATHVLSFDDRLAGAKPGMTLRGIMDVSVRTPDAFDTVFDPEPIYESVFDDTYPGPDREPRE